MRNAVVIIFFVTGMLMLPIEVLAIGVAVKPERLAVDAVVGQRRSTSVLVMNITDEPALYRVYPSSLAGIITISPSEFILQPGEQRLVNVSVRSLIPQAVDTDVAVVARPLAAAIVATASGVKVPLHLVVRFTFWHMAIVVAAVSCIAGVFIVRWSKKNHNNNIV